MWNKIQQVWNEIDIDFCLKLIDTMPQWINDVLKAGGGESTPNGDSHIKKFLTTVKNMLIFYVVFIFLKCQKYWTI